MGNFKKSKVNPRQDRKYFGQIGFEVIFFPIIGATETSSSFGSIKLFRASKPLLEKALTRLNLKERGRFGGDDNGGLPLELTQSKKMNGKK